MPNNDKFYDPDTSECLTCGKRFVSITESGYIKKYCSNKCRTSFGISKCKNCGIEFNKISRSNIYCSSKCSVEFRKSKAPSAHEWLLLCDLIHEKFNYKCRECGSDKNMVVHHILPLSFGGTNNIDNLELLCSRCHSHKHYDLVKNL